MMGRGWAAAQSVFKSREIEERETQHAPLPVEHIPVAPKLSTIEDAYNRAKSLVLNMEQRKAFWEEQIRLAEDELRQAKVVLAGAYQLQHTIEEGMRGVEKDKLIHDEIDTTVSVKPLSDEELKQVIRESMTNEPGAKTGSNWADVLNQR